MGICVKNAQFVIDFANLSDKSQMLRFLLTNGAMAIQ